MFRNVYIRSFRQRSGAWLYWVSCQTLVLCGSRPQTVLKHLEDGRLTMQIYLYVVPAVGEDVSECYCLQNQKLGWAISPHD